MTDSIWKSINKDTVLFIVDAAHSVEEKLLRDWVTDNLDDLGISPQVSYCVVPIADDPENISSEELALALTIDPQALVVPVRVVWKTPLDRRHGMPKLRDLWRGNPRRPSKRKASSILKRDKSLAQCVIGQPASLDNLSERYEQRNDIAVVSLNLADYVAEQASLALEVAERRVRGSRYKVPRQVSKQVRASDCYKRGLQELNRWIISLGYENEVVVDVEKLERYRSIVREHPTALLWTHKTHMDGITMQSVLFENDFPPPHTMGGINMAFAGVGFLARRSGAIFIRRSFQDNPLYKLVLRQYLKFLLDKRFPLTWSFEGTRSRVGKLMPPRYGMLKYVMDAMQESEDDYLHIIPVAINYDLNNDVKDYAAEQSGARKRPESLKWFISYLRRMRQPLGRIYVDFGEPVVVEKNALNNDRLALQKVAFKVGVEANRVTPITLTSLMCLSLLGAAPRAQTIDELQQNMNTLRDWAEHRGIQFTNDFDGENQSHMIELIDVMVNNKLLKCYDQGPQTVYGIGNTQHAVASYYRNTIAHHFISKAISELALLEAQQNPDNPLEAFWREADRLRDMFKFEFFYAPSDEFHADIDSGMVFYDKDWKENINNPDWLESILNSLNPLVAHTSLTPYIEAYSVVADCFSSLEANQTMSEEETLDTAFKYARQAYLQRRITSKASIGQMLFKNAYKLLSSFDLVEKSASTESDSVLRERRQKTSQDFRVLSKRLAKIRKIATPDEVDSVY